MSGVKNAKGEVISIDLLHLVLEIRMQMVEQLYESFKNSTFFKGKNPRSMIVSCFGLKIAEDITPAVCLALYARWKDNNDDHIGEIKKILVIPGSNWSDRLALALKNLVDEVIGRRESGANPGTSVPGHNTCG